MFGKKPSLSLVAALFFLISLAACSSGSSTGGAQNQTTGAQTDYNQTKSMVLDILHTKEGKQAIKDLLQDPSFKQSVIINEHDVTTALNKSLTDGNNRSLIEAQMKDPKFAAALVESTKKEHTQLLKSLLKDPEYQKNLLTVLQDPQYTQYQTSLFRTPTVRQEIQKIMMESMQNPQFKALFIQTVKENLGAAALPQLQGKEQQEGKKSSEEEGQDEQGG